MSLGFESRDGGHRLRSEVWLPFRRETVFDFFADAGNLERLTPPWLRFEVLTDLSLEMREGLLIDYRLRLRGIPMRWRSEISLWDPPYRFVDEMRRGPYREWIHEHRFEERDGGTLVIDEVNYAVPGGAAVHRLLVRPDLERIFRYRRERLEPELRADLEQDSPSAVRSRRGRPRSPHATPAHRDTRHG